MRRDGSLLLIGVLEGLERTVGILHLGVVELVAEGLAEGLVKGRTEGRTEEKLNNARNLIANGVPLDVIAKSLSIPLDELNKM